MSVWFLSILFGYFFFLAGEMELWNNVNTVEGDDRKTVRRRRRRLRHLFFLSSFFSILPLGGRRLLNALTTQRPTALCSSSASSHLRFFFYYYYGQQHLCTVFQKNQRWGIEKGSLNALFETSHRPWLFGNPRPCCCLHRNDPRVDKLSRRKEIGEGRSTSTAPKSHWFFIIIIIIFFSSTTRKGFPASFFFIFTRPLSATTLHELISVRLPAFDVDPNLPSRRAKYHRGEKEGTDGNYLFFEKQKVEKKTNSKRRDGNCPAAKTRFPLCWWRALRWSLTRKGTFFSSVSVLFHSHLGWKNRQHFPRDPQKRRSYL